MKAYNNLGELATEYGMPAGNIEKTLKHYNEVAEKQAKSPDDGPFDAYGGGKSHDPWGKKFFVNVPVEPTDSFHVAIVTPVIHYCMGGLKINPDSEVLGKDDTVIGGLYGAGEAAGGIHGENRLGGNSLLHGGEHQVCCEHPGR